MPARNNKKRYTGYRRAWPKFSALVWLTWAGALVCGIVIIVFQAVAPAKIPETTTYLGTLRPKHDLATVTLPAGAILRDILVKPSEHVTKGQTLAVLDVEAMRSHKQKLNTDLSVVTYLMSCLRKHAPPDLENSHSEVERSELLLAENECTEIHDRIANDTSDLLSQVSQIEADKALVRQYYELSVSKTDAANFEEIRKLLALSLLENQFGQYGSRLEAAAKTANRAGREARNTKLRRLISQAQEIAHKIVLLEGYIANPRISSSVSGVITRVRRPKSSVASPSENPILQIENTDADAFLAEFYVPVDDKDMFRKGDRIKISVLGFQGQNISLDGLVEHIGAAETSHLTLKVILDPAELNALNDLRSGLSFHGSSSAVQTEVRRETVSFFQKLSETILAAWQPIHQRRVD